MCPPPGLLRPGRILRPRSRPEEGAGISAQMDHDPTAATVAAILVDAALAS
jgi:hypothetical protein